jgi:uridine kinase
LVDSDVVRILVRLNLERRHILLIDGGSGAGKTELARRLAPELDAVLVSLDDIYPGWDGLEAAGRAVRTDVIERHTWTRWDWSAGQPAETSAIDTGRSLVIEGCGALSADNRALATFGVWLEVDEPTRKARALARDGETYAPHWDRWARQEREFFARERPDLLADLVLTGDRT